MADASGLASIIAGNDPQSADILQAMHDEQARNYVHDPSNWQGGGLLGGFARVLASAAMPNNTGLVGQIAQNRVAAQPDEAKLMASPDPYAEAAANPGKYSPIAMAQLLSGATPASAADARMKAAQAAGLQNQLQFRNQFGAALGRIIGNLGARQAPASPAPAQPGIDALGAAAQPGGANFGNPADLVGHFESEGLAQKLGISPYDIGFGGSDLSKAPADANGFPMWSGKQGPEGVSHAAGRYQFEPGTWAKYAPAAGVSDFSPESQDKVFQAAYADQGFKPWAPYNPALSLAIAGGAGRGAPAQSGGSSSPQRTASPSAGGESAQVGGPETLVTERSDPALAQQINASPATGAPIPLDGPAALAAAGTRQAPTVTGPPIAPQIRPVGAPPPIAGAATQTRAPGGGLNPRDVAALGILGQLGGMGDVAKPLETMIYNDPAYKGQVAGAEAGARNQSDLQFKPQIAGQTKQAELPATNAAEEFKTDQAIRAKMNEPQNVRPGGQVVIPSQVAAGEPTTFTNTGEAGERGKQLADRGKTYLDEANGARSQNYLLDQMYHAAKGFTPGAGADEAATAKSYINAIFPDAFSESLPSYQEFKKYAIQNAREQTRSMGAGEAASVFNTNIEANPNAQITMKALTDIMGGMHALNDYKLGRDQAAADWRTQHGTMEGFDNSDWMKNNPIMKFKLPYMTTDELRVLHDQMKQRK